MTGEARMNPYACMPNWHWVFFLMVALAVNISHILAQGTKLDPYGGDPRVKGEATGWFHVEQIHDRHFLITPAGNGFFSLGVNHIQSAFDHSPTAVREGMDESEFSTEVKDQLERWNFNTCGYGCPPALEDVMPYLVSIRLTDNGHYLPRSAFSFNDVFDTSFVNSMEGKILASTQQHRDNPYLIGYYWTDTPRWTLEISRRKHGDDWVSFIKNLGPGTAGKQAYVQFLEDTYQDIQSFNQAYRVNYPSFEALLSARFDHLDPNMPNCIRDDQAFLIIIAEQIYSTIHQIFKNADPNHLLLGDKFLSGDLPPEVLRVAAKYSDVISIQPGPSFGPGPGQGEEEYSFQAVDWDQIYAIAQKPILICDHQTSFRTQNHAVTLWYQHPSEKHAADHYQQYLSQVVNNPNMIGYQRCQYQDLHDLRRGLLKQGLNNQEGQPYRALTDRISKANRQIWESIFN